MLLQALVENSKRRRDLAPSMYDYTPIRWIVELDSRGEFKGFTKTTDGTGGKNDRGVRMAVPYALKASGVVARLLADNAEYALGLVSEKRDEEKVRERHQAFVEQVRKCADRTNNREVKAVLRFLENVSSTQPFPPDLDASDNVTFRVGTEFPIDSEIVRAYWAKAGARTDGRVLTCGVCNKEEFCLETHAFKVKDLPGGQQAGMTIFGINADAFESYGLPGALTSPICLNCGETAIKALNALLRSERSSIRVGPTAYVFWTREQLEFDIATLLSKPEAGQVRMLFEAPFTARDATLSMETNRFYAVALTANNARVAVRDWIEMTLTEAQTHLRRYFSLQRIADPGSGEMRPIGVFPLAASTVQKDIPARTVDALLHLALQGGALPLWILQRVLERNRTEQMVTRPRAALTRMVLLSHGLTGEGENTMVELDHERRDPAYLCGRLLAVLENLQHAAIPGLETGIVERFYGAASATPAVVFPTLMRKAQAHLGKLDGAVHEAIQRRIEEIIVYLPEFPNTLSLIEQGLFSLGYYHQRAHDRAQARERKQSKAAAAAEN